MKAIVILAGLLCCGQVFAQCCPYMGSVTVLPENPTENDSIRIVTSVTTPNIGALINHSFTVSGYDVELSACYYEGMLTAPLQISDTFELGTLPAGIYSTQFTAYNSIMPYNCDITDTQTYTMNFTVGALGLPGAELATWSLYPNPAHEQVIVSGAIFPAEVRVLSADGRELKAKYVDAGEKMILDVHVLPTGLYLIEVNGERRPFIRN
jgi:hypothetical protein